MAGVIMGMDGRAINDSRLGSRQLNKYWPSLWVGAPVKATLIDSSTLSFLSCAGKVILEAYLTFPA